MNVFTFKIIINGRALAFPPWTLYYKEMELAQCLRLTESHAVSSADGEHILLFSFTQQTMPC